MGAIHEAPDRTMDGGVFVRKIVVVFRIGEKEFQLAAEELNREHSYGIFGDKRKGRDGRFDPDRKRISRCHGYS